jgi:O-antigen/teichoic acid export membrane protein
VTASGGGSFFVDVRNTTATQVLVAILNVASLAIVSRRFGDVGLGLYALERRGAALIQPLVLLGVTVATPRFVAISIGRRSGADGSYAVTGLLVVGGMAAAAAALIVAWPAPVAAAVFGDPRSVGLARALGGLVLAVAAYQVVYAVFRGYLCMGRANLLELATVGLIPVCLAAVGPTDFLAFMWTLDGALLAVTLLSLAT